MVCGACAASGSASWQPKPESAALLSQLEPPAARPGPSLWAGHTSAGLATGFAEGLVATASLSKRCVAAGSASERAACTARAACTTRAAAAAAAAIAGLLRALHLWTWRLRCLLLFLCGPAESLDGRQGGGAAQRGRGRFERLWPGSLSRFEVETSESHASHPLLCGHRLDLGAAFGGCLTTSLEECVHGVLAANCYQRSLPGLRSPAVASLRYGASNATAAPCGALGACTGRPRGHLLGRPAGERRRRRVDCCPEGGQRSAS